MLNNGDLYDPMFAELELNMVCELLYTLSQEYNEIKVHAPEKSGQNSNSFVNNIESSPHKKPPPQQDVKPRMRKFFYQNEILSVDESDTNEYKDYYFPF